MTPKPSAMMMKSACSTWNSGWATRGYDVYQLDH